MAGRSNHATTDPVLLFLTLAALTGCSPYYDDYRYSPRPAVAEIHPTNGPRSTVATAMASVIGFRRADRDRGIPDSVELRLRLENSGNDPITFDPRTLVLTSGQLVTFPPPILRAPDTITLDSGQATSLTVFFPFPPRVDWDQFDTLVLRWIVRIRDQPVTQTLRFRRVYVSAYYYDPYWGPYRGYPPYFWYGGVVVFHRR